MNPLLQGMMPPIGGMDPRIIQSVKNMAGILQTAKNPQAALMQAAQQNPMLGNIMQMCQGRNPKEVFYAQCKQHGADADSIISQLRQAGLDLK